MNFHLPPHLRTTLLFLLVAAATLAVGGVIHGWSTLPAVIPVPIALAAALYIWGQRDSEAGAVIRRELDERQQAARMQVQALVGRVLSLAAAVGYMLASMAQATMWPWAVLLGLMVGSFLLGWLLYGEHRWRER